MRRLLITITLAFTVSLTLYGQDPQFSQFYAAPLYLNPAYTGTGPKAHHRFVANYRNQWPSISNAFVTYAFSYDYYHRKLNSGFGVLFTKDQAGSAGLRSTNIGLSYSYKIHVAKKWVITPGIQFAYNMRDIDFNKLIFSDQLRFRDSNGEVPPVAESLARSYRQASYLDFSSGILIYNESIWFGISSYHMNEPNQSLLDREDRIPRKTSIHAGYKIPLYRGPAGMKKMSSVAPSFIYKKQGEFDQLDVGIQFHYSPITAGFWYRGIPVSQDIPDHINHDALTFLFGLRFEEFNVGYSYDITVSDLVPSTGGAHELSLIYQFERRGTAKVRSRKEKFIPCPSF